MFATSKIKSPDLVISIPHLSWIFLPITPPMFEILDAVIDDITTPLLIDPLLLYPTTPPIPWSPRFVNSVVASISIWDNALSLPSTDSRTTQFHKPAISAFSGISALVSQPVIVPVFFPTKPPA